MALADNAGKRGKQEGKTAKERGARGVRLRPENGEVVSTEGGGVWLSPNAPPGMGGRKLGKKRREADL